MKKAIIVLIGLAILGGVINLFMLDTASKTFAIDVLMTLAMTTCVVVLLAIICYFIGNVETLEAKVKALETDRSKIIDFLNNEFPDKTKKYNK